MATDSSSRSTSSRSAPSRTGLRRRLNRLGRDYLYVLAGLPLAVASLAVLLTLSAAALITVVVWVGALLMPVALLVASAFARLSRRRLRAWGSDPAPVVYRPAGRGPLGLVRLMGDPRRWLDLAFEGGLAFPVRLVTFVVAVVWTGVAVGGLTLWIWWGLVPGQTLWPVQLLQALTPDLAPQTAVGRYWTDAAGNFLLGLVFLVSLPAVLRAVARFDGHVTEALLGGEAVSGAPSPPAETAGIPLERPAGAVPVSRWVWAGACFAALALLAVSWPLFAALYGLSPAVAMGLAVGHSAAIALAVRWPWAGIGVSFLTSLATMVLTVELAALLPWPWPVTAIVAQCVLVALLALRHQWYWAVGAWSVGAFLTALAFVLTHGGTPGGLANGVVLVSVTAVLTVLGILERLWRQGTARAQQAEELSAEEAQRRRDLEERNRIARDMHDIVAHSMSVINVQASTAQYRKSGIDVAVQQEFDDIANSSRQALAEMRSLLAVLRGDDAVPTAPVPTLGDIPELVATARASGAEITDQIDGEAPPTVGLTAYRIVQEALSNALRHAPGSQIKVTTALESGGRVLRVSVVNSAPREEGLAAPGSGFGLAGIRERVSALGGRVLAEPTAAGGFRISASLPVLPQGDGPRQREASSEPIPPEAAD